MNIKRKLMYIVSCLLIGIILPIQVSASNTTQTHEQTYYFEKNNTEVVIKSDACNTPEEDIAEIAYDNPNTRIIISNYVKASPVYQPRLFMGVEITKRNTTQSNYVDKDSFVISVAKGSNVSLSQTWSQSLTASATHSDAISALKLNGPPETSAYNSREYRVRFYADRGTYEGYYITDMGKGPSISGSFKNPLYYAEYSIDHKI